MNKYTLVFTGRLKGAIGIFERHTLTLAAPSPADALEKAYDTHEHIQQIRMTEWRDRYEIVVHPKEYDR